MQSLVQPFDGSAIPQELKDLVRWAPWRAVFNPQRGKVDKIPKNAKTPEYGISTAAPEKWFTFNTALDAFTKSRGMLAGLGLVMTDIEGVVGVDLDNCIDANGTVAAWALEVVRLLASYTEISPSGRGMRIFVRALVDGPDWNNHEVGIEVYGGRTPRFLTVSGKHYEKAPREMASVAPGVLAALRGTYGRASGPSKLAKKDLPPMPDLVDVGDVPVLSEYDLPSAARDFLHSGEATSEDRSRALHSTSVALLSAGLTPAEVFSTLVHNSFSMEVALDHRRQDSDRAAAYLWEHHVVAAQPKARTKALTASDFDAVDVVEDLESDAAYDAVGEGAGVEGADGAVAVASDFEDVSGKSPVEKPPKPRFDICTATEYYARVKTLKWFIKGVLPRAEISAVFGASGSGKTFVTLDMVCKIAMGRDWYGRPTMRSKVLYVAAEGASGMRDRVFAWCRHNDVDMSELDGWLYILGDQPNMLEKDDVKALVRAARAKCSQVALVVFDTLAQVTPGSNENSGEDMGAFLGHAKAVGKALGAHTLLVGHTGKDTQKGMRGWSGLKGAMDSECEVIRTNNFRALTVSKLKDGVGEGMEYRFTLATIQLEFDAEDGDISSAVAVEGEVLSDSGARQTATEENKPAKATKVSKGPREAAVHNFLMLRGGSAVPLETAVEELAAHLAKTGGESVGFTPAQVENKEVRGLIKKVIRKLENLGLLVETNGVITISGKSVENPETGTCDF